MKKHLLTGIMILLPIEVTIWIVNFCFDLLTKPFLFIGSLVIERYGLQPVDHPGLLLLARFVILILLFFFTILLGWVAQKIVFRYFISLFHKLIRKIPFVKFVHQIVEQTLKSLFSNKKNPFSQVVALKFPNDETTTLAFHTGDAPKILNPNSNDSLASIFVPTAPHPMSGFLLLASKDKIKKLDVTSEDVFKILFSCGTYDPENP